MKNFTKEHSMMAKGVAIMLLLFYHLFHEKQEIADMAVNHAPLSENTFLLLAGFGNICVAVFVFLTAYGISTGVFEDKLSDIKKMYLGSGKRFGKLMLNFLWVYVTMNLLCFPYFNYPSLYGEGKQGVLLMLVDALGLSPVFDTPILNGTWWYMKVAYLLILLVPLMALAVRKLGNVALLLGALLPYAIQMDADLERYFFTAVLGVVAAYGKWPEKIMNLKIHPVFTWILALAGSILCVLTRQNAAVKDYFWNYADAFIALFIVCAVVMTVGSVPVLNTVLRFLGKHSMNIFLCHTFFYLIVWRNYIYYFKYAAVTFLILLGVSLLYSVLLELVKAGTVKIFKLLKKKVKKV